MLANYILIGAVILVSGLIALSVAARRKKIMLASGASSQGIDEMAKIIDITSEQQFKDVIASSQPALIKFSASWCPACVTQAPVVREVAKSFGKKVAFYNVDFDKFKPLARAQLVRALPTMIVVKPGTRHVHVGYLNADELKAFINEGLAKQPETK